MGESTTKIGKYELTKEQYDKITSHIARGEKVVAIKVLRDCTGASLSDAKYAIDQYDDSCKEEVIPPSPEQLDSYQAEASKKGCYVATCVYGSYDCKEVWVLRRFRDNTLDATWYGRAFIRCYYAISPTLVKWFGHTKWFQSFWKKKLDKLVDKLRKEGVSDTRYQDR